MTSLHTSVIRVFIADDHDFVQRGIRSFLATKKDIEIIGTATSGEETLQQVKQVHPDVIIMDISLQGSMNGFTVTKQLKEEGIQAPVIILTMTDDNEEYIKEFSACGAKAYVLKQNPPEELYTAIELVNRGQTFLSSGISAAILSLLHRGKDEEELTPTELTIAKLTAQGKKAKEIGDKLSISHRTVEKHREEIMRKWDVHGIADIVRVAMRKKLI